MLLSRFLMYLLVPLLAEERLALLFLPPPLGVYLVVILGVAHHFIDVRRVQRVYLGQRVRRREVFCPTVVQPVDHFDPLVPGMQGILHT